MTPASRSKASGSQKAGRSYSDQTLKLLWGRSAGHCAMPDCRIELFEDATNYDPIVVIGEMGHVAGASDDGPRARPELSASERNDYKNLILLCRNCHRKVDQQSVYFTDERLRDIKQAHEAWVRASLPERGRSTTGWTALVLEGDHPLDPQTTSEAISPDFFVESPQKLKVAGNPSNWSLVDDQIATKASELLSVSDIADRRVAIFPLAPVSACISLGFHLTSRSHVRLFQSHRDERSWTWPRRMTPANDIVASVGGESTIDARAVAFLFHFSAVITDAAIADFVAASTPRFDIRATHIGTSWLVHPDQLTWASSAARDAFERSMRLFPNAEVWHILFAGPAPLAVALGQQINPTMYPPVQLYEYRHSEKPPYQQSILLRGRGV
jgi:hypothetical protein